MKKLMAVLVALMMIPAMAGAETVVTSFYPLWIFTLNLTQGLEGVTVKNLAAPTVGCLHDYQLQTADMKTLNGADVFLVNGAGMEAFLTQIQGTFPNLPVVIASENIPLLAETGALVLGDEEEEGVNAHLWLDAGRAIQMSENLAEGLIRVMPDRKEAITANLTAWKGRLTNLDEELKQGLKDLPRKDIITFHEAFPYFAEAYGLRVAAVVNKEPGETVSPAQMARLAETIRSLGNPPLFVEPQYEDLSARVLASETGAPVYTLDPVVTGPEENPPLDYYETVMRQNIETLREALGQEKGTDEE